jgi:hypothetical protein
MKRSDGKPAFHVEIVPVFFSELTRLPISAGAVCDCGDHALSAATNADGADCRSATLLTSPEIDPPAELLYRLSDSGHRVGLSKNTVLNT